MKIMDNYDINRILIDIEVALKIDGKDYSERDIEKVLTNINNRIITDYQLDLRDKKATDDTLFIGRSRSSAVLFIENMALLHARLCGYLQIVRYTKHITIRPININYMGVSEQGFRSFFIAAMGENSMVNLGPSIRAIKNKFSSVNNCIEKKLMLILIVSYEFGLYELVASIAEIMYLGMKL